MGTVNSLKGKKMMPLEKLRDRFNIPLTFLDPRGVFKSISPDSKYYQYIKMVYAPVHIDDGGSGRTFAMHISKVEYIRLLRAIMRYKPVYITYPFSDLRVMEEYINYGVMDWMISEWDDGFYGLKAKYPSLKINRSIVGNAYSPEIDKRFDKTVISYFRLMDLDWIKQQDRNRITVIPNQTCQANCRNLDNHLIWIVKTNVTLAGNRVTTCPEKTTNFFVPRDNIEMMIDYIDDIKVLDRALNCFYYEQYLDYYIFDEMFDLDDPEIKYNPQLRVIFSTNLNTLKNRANSNIITGNCKFKCSNCDRKCY